MWSVTVTDQLEYNPEGGLAAGQCREHNPVDRILRHDPRALELRPWTNGEPRLGLVLGAGPGPRPSAGLPAGGGSRAGYPRAF